MRTLAAFAASAAALVVFTLAPAALALGPLDIELAGKLGYGSNGLGFGAGARAGLSIIGLYGGFNIVDYPGAGTAQGGGHVLTYGGEVGYGIKIAFVAIRPLVGFGNESVSTNALTGTGIAGPTSVSTSSFYVQPGGLLQLTFGHFLIGVDASALIPTSATSASAFVINGELGVTF